MKTVWIAAILFMVVLTGSLILFIYTTALYNELQESLYRICQAVEKDDWAAAQRESRELQKIWAKTDSSWAPIMDHHQVDHLDESLTRVIKLVEMHNREESLVEVTVAMRMAKRIKDTELPTIRNIF